MVSADRIQITLRGGAPWGFRLSGGGGLPLIINKIRKKSQAHVQGLKEGDAVIAINGEHVHDKTQDEALELVEAAGDALTLEIFRGDIEQLSRDKPRKTIQIPSSSSSAQAGTIRLLTTSDDGVSPGEVILIPSGDSVTSVSLDNTQTGGSRVKPAGTSVRVISVDSSTVRTVTVPPSHITLTQKSAVLDKAPVISMGTVKHDLHSASTQPTVAAKPFFVSQPSSEGSDSLPKNPPPFGHQPPQAGPTPQEHVIYPAQYVSHQQSAPRLAPQPRRSPQPPPISPKPDRLVAYQPVQTPGVTSAVTSTTFDDGQTHREVTREQHFQRSDDGKSTTFVQRETTKTSTGRPSFVKNQASTFNVVPPSQVMAKPQRLLHQSTTTLKPTTNISNQKGPKPFLGSAPSNILQPQFQMSPASTNRSNDNQFFNTEAPLFKLTKFVPSSGQKAAPGLYTPTSPLVDFNFQGGFNDGKENMSPQPMFQVKNNVSDKAKSSGSEMWRPNMWLPGQQPAATQQQLQATTPKEDISASFPTSMGKPGYSLVEEQKRKLMALHAPRNEYDDTHGQENLGNIYDQGHHKHGRLHVFAPPVEIHADQESPYFPYDDHDNMDDYDDGPSSPDSYGTRKKNMYSDSAFYDTPGKSYPTITDQMKLCKSIAQSLTSAANRRAKGAKMFMKRKRKSTKWIHEGQSEFSSSAGDVANLHELDSELNHDEGGNKPLLYFKIPNVKHRVGNEAKQTKMALTQEQFEKLRLNSKKCDHKSLPPDPCFDIVADLKAHKGRGGRLFERRKQRSDKFVIDETNAKFTSPHANFDSSAQTVGHHLNPREVALKHGWKGDPTSTQAVLTAPLVRSSLKSEDSPCMIKGTNFNRTAKGWTGGGEYPVADSLHHISPIRELGPPQPAQPIFQSEQQHNYNRIKAWQAAGESPSASSPIHSWNQGQQDTRRQDNRHARAHEEQRGKGWGQQRPPDRQGPRPKSWQAESYDPQRYGDVRDGSYATIDYRHGSGGYPSVAYKQPIIPGTDL